MEKLSKFKKIILLLIVVLSVFKGYSQTKCTVYDIPELKTENLKSLNLVTSITTPKIIRVNIHFILRTNGTGNFTETTDVYGVQNAYTGYWFAEKVIEQCNYWLNNNPEMTQQLSCCPIDVLDINYNYQLAGVFFDRNDTYFNNTGIHTGVIKNGAHVINILVYANPSGNGAAALGGNICWKNGAEAAYDNFLLYGNWGIYNYMSLGCNHEVGHCLSLLHAKRTSSGDCCTSGSPTCHDNCTDTPTYQQLINDGYTDPCIWNGPGYSNNIMDYSPLETAFTPCQIEQTHNHIDQNKHFFKYGVFQNSTATINSFTDNATYIATNVDIPSGSSVTIPNGKRLYIDAEGFEVNGGFEVPSGSVFEFTPYGM